MFSAGLNIRMACGTSLAVIALNSATGIQFQPFTNDGHEHVSADGDHNLGLHRVLGGPVKGLDPLMLLIHLKNNSTCPRGLYILAMVSAGSTKLLVRDRNRFKVSGST